MFPTLKSRVAFQAMLEGKDPQEEVKKSQTKSNSRNLALFGIAIADE